MKLEHYLQFFLPWECVGCFGVISCITLSSQTIIKPGLKGNLSLLGLARVLCRAKSEEEKQSMEQWEMMGMNPAASIAAPLWPSGHLLHPAATGLSDGIACVLWEVEPEIPHGIVLCDRNCCLALPRREQVCCGSPGLCSHHFTCSPSQVGLIHGARGLVANSCCL